MIRGLGLLAIVMLVAHGPTAARAADVVLDWNATMRNVIQHDGLNPVNKANPGWSTRAMAMVNGAIYDAFQATNRTHVPFMVDTFGRAGASLDAAVHQAAYELLLENYPGEVSIIQGDYDFRMALIPPGDARDDGIELGHSIAQSYLANRTGDHAADSLPYSPGIGPGEWRPDPYNPGQEAWGPGWGTVAPFAISSSAVFVDELPPIPDMTSPAYSEAFNMVKDYGAVDSLVRTVEQEEIGVFWAYDRPSMGPPPVLFLRNLGEIAEQAGNSPDDNARLFAMASVAQADAAIAAWDAKFQYNFWRPVAAIQEADTDGNPDTIQDAMWRPLGAPGDDPLDMNDDFTPPFPAWTSGHATMGGAVFKAIELFFGTNSFDEIDGVIGDDPFYFLTSQEEGSGDMRFYNTFTQVGPLGIDEFGVGTENSPEGENGMSRIYLGIHWIFDQQDGIALGNSIAHYVSTNYFQPVPEPSAIWLAIVGIAGLGVRFGRRRRRKVE
jgi:hypothetical protein